jgi:hypothetical protein
MKLNNLANFSNGNEDKPFLNVGNLSRFVRWTNGWVNMPIYRLDNIRINKLYEIEN